MKPTRVEALSDGIFAIAMILLVLGLTVPDAAGASPDALRQLLLDDWPRFTNFTKGFLLLAVFWKIHHKEFHAIKRVDETFVWLNFVALLFVVLIPFSTSLEGSFPGNQLAAVIFHANMLAVGCAYFVLWYYATHSRCLIDDAEYDRGQIRISHYRAMIIPFVACVAITLTFIDPSWSSLAYALIPLILIALGQRQVRAAAV